MKLETKPKINKTKEGKIALLADFFVKILAPLSLEKKSVKLCIC